MNSDDNDSVGWIVLVVILALFVLPAIGFWTYSNYAPKYAEVDRNVANNTQEWQRSHINDLRKDFVQYTIATDPTTKKAIANHACGVADELVGTPLPNDLVGFVEEARRVK